MASRRGKSPGPCLRFRSGGVVRGSVQLTSKKASIGKLLLFCADYDGEASVLRAVAQRFAVEHEERGPDGILYLKLC